jgi:hypothetical protein
MPNRILRDWTDSDAINAISWQAEVFFTRLIMKVDDYGRFSANPKLLRSLLFPIRDGVRDADISRDLAECEKAGLIATYESEGKVYLEIVKFGNTPRAKTSKFPALASNLQASASKCKQMQANAPVTVTETGFVTETVPPTPKGDEKEANALMRARSLFRMRESTPLDKAQAAAWKAAKNLVMDTPEEDWLALEQVFSSTDPDTVKYRKQNLSTLLNQWNDCIIRAKSKKHAVSTLPSEYAF